MGGWLGNGRGMISLYILWMFVLYCILEILLGYMVFYGILLDVLVC